MPSLGRNSVRMTPSACTDRKLIGPQIVPQNVTIRSCMSQDVPAWLCAEQALRASQIRSPSDVAGSPFGGVLPEMRIDEPLASKIPRGLQQTRTAARGESLQAR
jgi:hypothetical protein